MIPESLKSMPRWVNWVKKPPHGKVPLQHCDKPETWLTFEEAKSRCSKEPFIGLGIQLGPPIVGVDLDWKDDETAVPFETIPAYARDIIDRLQSYTEWSPSGKGCHVLCSGRVDQAIKTKNIEVYGEGRFFTVTENFILDVNVAPYQPLDRDQSLVPAGMRNNDLAAEAGRILQKKEVTSAEELIERLKVYAKHHHVEGNPDDPKLESIGRRFWDKYKTNPDSQELLLTNMEDVKDEKMEWLWEGKVPLNHITAFVGQPGAGKSSMAHWLAAEISRRGMRTLILGAEEHMPTSTKPRLRCMGANLALITRAQVKGLDDKANEISLDTQVSKLMTGMPQDTKLIIIDPIASYLGELNMNKETEVRSLLAVLSDLAQERKIAIIIISHFNKKDSTDAKDRVLGAKAFVGYPRVVWTFQKDPDDMEKRVMVPGKAEHLQGMYFDIVKATDEASGNEVGIIVPGGVYEGTGDSVLEEHRDKPSERLKKDIVAYVLEQLELAGTSVDAGRLKAQASETFRVSVKTVERAVKGKVGVEMTGGGRSRKYIWKLLDTSSDPVLQF